MCGIIGYTGHRSAQTVLLEGLRRLEYRGYDSAGIAVLQEQSVACCKSVGRIQSLADKVSTQSLDGNTGIGHTRWATHGGVTEANAHPHFGGDQRISLVHNGVIENYRDIRNWLEKEGYTFQSSTDTEVIAHWIDLHLQKQSPGQNSEQFLQQLSDNLAQALKKLKGAFGLAILFRDYPELIAAVRVGSPLVLATGEGEHFIASDASALQPYSNRLVYLNDHEIALITLDDIHLYHPEQGPIQPYVQVLEAQAQDVELGEYPHYMLKEICEQDEAVRNAMRGRINLDEASAHFGGLNIAAKDLINVDRIILLGCGTSWHAALLGEYLIEELARIPVEVEYASEFRYRNAPMNNRTLFIALTQSGETADTLAALKEAKRKGHHTLSICNVVGSSIAREADGGIYLHAGLEIGVASTKAFTAQVTVLTLLALYLGRMRHLSFPEGRKIIHNLQQLPDTIKKILPQEKEIQRIAKKYTQCSSMLYLGRHYQFPVALEGALKLKEVSYIHAEGYPAAEMKHGPIALVEENTPSIFLIPKSEIYDKVLSNIEEVRARSGKVIAIATEGDDTIKNHADDVIYIPETAEFLQPILSVIPLQLLAYHIALLLGCDVDKPRNLAKSVTVE